jgi:hypothetical protein
VHGLVFFSDALAAPPLLITGLLAILLLLALRRARAIAE